MEKLILIIGGNLGDRLALIQKATVKLCEKFGFFTESSSIFETEAWGGQSSGNYLNQVLIFQTDQKPKEILELIWEIENECGRERVEKWGNRTMDIDILYLGKRVIDEKDLKIPHPHISERKFVLIPLAEIISEFVHPVFGKTQAQMLQSCTDKSKVEKYQKSPD